MQGKGWIVGRWMLLLGLLLALVVPAGAEDAGRSVLLVEAEGPLTPAMVSYIQRGVRTAEERGVEAMILRLDTPGGQIDLMNEIIQAIRESRVPVVVYVAPRGAIAGSAGTLITLAGHAAAMAPETAIGAASPVGGSGEDLNETLARKAKEALKAQARGLAERRGEEAVKLAEAAIEEAKAVSASEALEAGLVDFVADSLEELLAQLDGFTVQVQGEEQLLRTAGARIERLPMNPIEQLLHVVVNPNVVFLLFTIGVQAILIEISSPGGWVAGFIGVVCLALGIYGIGVLPVNWLGLIFIVVAFVLFVLDIKAPTHGALTAAGIASLVAGALILFNSAGAPSYARISVPFVLGVAVTTSAFFLFIVTKAIQAQRAPAMTGAQGLVGATARVRSELNPQGTVFLMGEYWTAEAEDGPIPAGEEVEVVGVEGIRLRVRRKTKGGWDADERGWDG